MKGKVFVENLGVNRMIILKCLIQHTCMCNVDEYGSECGPLAGCCELFVKGREITYSFSEALLTYLAVFAPWSYLGRKYVYVCVCFSVFVYVCMHVCVYIYIHHGDILCMFHWLCSAETET